MPDPTYTFTVLNRDTQTVEHVTTYGTLAEGYEALALPSYSIRSVYTHAAQTGLVAFADGSRYGAAADAKTQAAFKAAGVKL